jgi:hypothetical protein
MAASAVFMKAYAQHADAQPTRAEVRPFGESTVRDMAGDLAKRPHRAPDDRLPREFTDLSYDDYRKLTFNRERALWPGEDLGFQVQLFHRGFLYSHKVELFEVVDRQARSVSYDPAHFNLEGRPPPGADFGYDYPSDACDRYGGGRGGAPAGSRAGAAGGAPADVAASAPTTPGSGESSTAGGYGQGAGSTQFG